MASGKDSNSGKKLLFIKLNSTYPEIVGREAFFRKLITTINTVTFYFLAQEMHIVLCNCYSDLRNKTKQGLYGRGKIICTEFVIVTNSQ